jgi:hypothetical protein
MGASAPEATRIAELTSACLRLHAQGFEAARGVKCQELRKSFSIQTWESRNRAAPSAQKYVVPFA